MLAEYEQLSLSLTESERIGEKRVEFLMSFAALVSGGASALAVVDVQDLVNLDNAKLEVILKIVIPASFLAVLLLGVLTLERILKRNYETDRLIQSLQFIRLYFARGDSEILPYLFMRGNVDCRDVGYFTFKKGSLLQTVAMINSSVVFFGIAVATILIGDTIPEGADTRLAVLSGSLALLFAVWFWVIQIEHIRRRSAQNWKMLYCKRVKDEAAHASSL